MQRVFDRLSARSLIINLCVALVIALGLSRAASAVAPSVAAPLMPDVSFMPGGTTWLLTLQFNSTASGESVQKTFFKNTIERRSRFRRLQKRIEKVLGVNLSQQTKSWWMFGSAPNPKSGTSVVDTSVSTGKIKAHLRHNADTSRDSYDGITIYRISHHARHGRGRKFGPIFIAVVKPGIILGSLSEKSIEHALDCHLGLKKSVSTHSHLFKGWSRRYPLYFSVVHIQHTIDAAQNPLMFPPESRIVKSIHFMVVPMRTTVRIYGHLHAMSAKAAMQLAAQLKGLKRLAYHANSRANATDRQMLLAGAILRLKINNHGSNVQFSWQIPYALLRRLQQPQKRAG